MSKAIHQKSIIPLKTSCHLQMFENQLSSSSHSPDNEAVTFQTHSMKFDLKKEQEIVLFYKLHQFIKRFLCEPEFHQTIISELSKDLQHKKSLKRISDPKYQSLSFKKMTFGSKICFEGETTKKQEVGEKKGRPEGRASRTMNKKISIFIMEQSFSSSSSSSLGDSLFSISSVKTLRQIQIPMMQLNVDTISLLYDTPSPFLINLSLCLFIRYCENVEEPVKFEGCAWLLGIATIVAYKIYYDEELEGLVDFFAGIFNINRKDLIDLERCFLETIKYNTIVRNYEYHAILSKLASLPYQKEEDTQ